eukprot:SAG25_NODE_474_length_7638_cov_5.842962_8_plen_139_part_00
MSSAPPLARVVLQPLTGMVVRCAAKFVLQQLQRFARQQMQVALSSYIVNELQGADLEVDAVRCVRNTPITFCIDGHFVSKSVARARILGQAQFFDIELQKYNAKLDEYSAALTKYTAACTRNEHALVAQETGVWLLQH